MRVCIAVSFDLPPGATRQDAVDYVADAVQCWKGSLRPEGGYGPDDEGDPMFYLNADSVQATTPITRGNKRRILRSE